jgi:hypothetical protein
MFGVLGKGSELTVKTLVCPEITADSDQVKGEKKPDIFKVRISATELALQKTCVECCQRMSILIDRD